MPIVRLRDFWARIMGLRMGCSGGVVLPILLLCIHLPGALTLKLHSIHVPPFVGESGEAELDCDFDMEGDMLYSVKWYKDEQEFYRFVPNDKPKLQTFKLRGINVNRKKSGRNKVVLRDLSLSSSGNYKCEVSAEAPNFRTKSDRQEMVVVSQPEKTLEIIGAKAAYSVGEMVNVTCIAFSSKPASSLTWRVNDEEVSPLYESYGGGPRLNYEDQEKEHQRQEQNEFANEISSSGDDNHDIVWDGGSRRNNRRRQHHRKRQRQQQQQQQQQQQPSWDFTSAYRPMKPKLNARLREYNPRVEKNGRETALLGLTFKVQPHHISGLRLECRGSIGSVYWQSYNVSPRVEQKKDPPPASSSDGWFTSPFSSSMRTFRGLNHFLLLPVLLLPLLLRP